MGISIVKPLVSIALCTYNGEEFIGEQIESILNQTYENLEVLVFDDVSTDDTVEILEKYTTDNRLKIYRNSQNIGYRKNLFSALSMCSGEFIGISDQDDIWNLSKIEELVTSIADHLLIYCDSQFMDSKGNIVGKKLSTIRYLSSISDNRNFSFPFLGGIYAHNILFSSKLTPYLTPYSDKLSADNWIGFVAATHGTIKYYDKPLTLYRQHSNTVTSKSNESLRDRYELSHTWLQSVTNYPNNPHKDFFGALLQLYSKNLSGKIPTFKFFYFCVLNRNILFPTKRKLIQRINYIRKLIRESQY